MKMTSTRRKLAIATWKAPAEGNILGRVTLDVSEAQKYLAAVQEKTGQKVSITHLVGKAVARGLEASPGLNGKILFGRFYPFETVDVTFLVAADGDLGKAKIQDVGRKHIAEIAAELKEYAGRIRSGTDVDFKKSMDAVRMIPSFLLGPVLWFTGWLAGALGVNFKALGVERHAFGSCVITSVGMLGFDEGFAPFTPFARVPLLVLVGAIKDSAVVVDGQVVVRPTMTITATIDHRFIDGAQLSTLAKAFKETIEDPFGVDPDLGETLHDLPQDHAVTPG